MPSTQEIKHEMRLMEAADALVLATSPDDMQHIVGDLAAKHGLSPERAQMLVDRFGIEKRVLEAAAQDLHMP